MQGGKKPVFAQLLVPVVASQYLSRVNESGKDVIPPQVLHVIANGKKNTHFKSPNLEVSDFDLHVREDGGRNSNNGDGTNSRGDSLKRSAFPSSASCPSTIRLAARSVSPRRLYSVLIAFFFLMREPKEIIFS